MCNTQTAANPREDVNIGQWYWDRGAGDNLRVLSRKTDGPTRHTDEGHACFLVEASSPDAETFIADRFNSHDALAAENARLREALTRIARWADYPLVQDIARAALGVK